MILSKKLSGMTRSVVLVKSYNHMVVKMKSLIEEVYVAGIRQKNAQFLALRTQDQSPFFVQYIGVYPDQGDFERR